MIPTSVIRWSPCYRIIPSRFPPIDLFERVTDPADLETVLEIESLTNDRLRDEVGTLRLIPPEDRISGPGTSPIMAAFTHLPPYGSRFTDGSFGVFYAGSALETSIAETKHHREAFMRATNEPKQELDMRVYAVDVNATLHDVRGMKDSRPDIYAPDSYSASQALAIQLRTDGSSGIAYDSVRDPKGECIAIFRPKVLFNCRQERHLTYVWDGAAISKIYEKRDLTL
ncbi:RES family NAD+ phosphorylase [Microvirga tunisiensis]|uniref:RES domain-containing protein n=1 Tax=Microvirga tunisiensis TaxID=2108360 RepID=A0A5N7MMT5_9HYPH|nr:RES family NAD+ phosphorylase [Microvirga tunisiensis]MPR10145.1 RES domain-containing protein [Microvirga tunisiensis]MPR28351.1 RES domain-containing protein [Microvirga tunisiensis]